MHIARSFTFVLAGLFAGVALVVSCSDDSPGNVDADTCNCPAAEPPITGRIKVVDGFQTIAANSTGGQGVECPEGSVLLSGSCTTDTVNPLRDVTLSQSGFYSPGREWNCWFKNNEATPVTIKVSVRCLAPAQ